MKTFVRSSFLFSSVFHLLLLLLNPSSPHQVTSHPHPVLPLAKQLSLLPHCRTDQDCNYFRPCYKNRCTGFAGSDYRGFSCSVGSTDSCVLDRVPGHFSPHSPVSLLFLNTTTATCGQHNFSTQHNFVVPRFNDNLNHNGPFFSCTIGGNVGPTANNQGDDACRVDLGPIQPHFTNVGPLQICGCSGTDVQTALQATNAKCMKHTHDATILLTHPCSSPADYSVPLGWLHVAGFHSITTAPHTLECGEMGDCALGNGGRDSISPTHRPLGHPHQPRRYVCVEGAHCMLDNTTGYHLREGVHFLRLLPEAPLLPSASSSIQDHVCERWLNPSRLERPPAFFKMVFGGGNSSTDHAYVSPLSGTLEFSCQIAQQGRKCIVFIPDFLLQLVQNLPGRTAAICGCTDAEYAQAAHPLRFSPPSDDIDLKIETDQHVGTLMYKRRQLGVDALASSGGFRGMIDIERILSYLTTDNTRCSSPTLVGSITVPRSAQRKKRAVTGAAWITNRPNLKRKDTPAISPSSPTSFAIYEGYTSTFNTTQLIDGAVSAHLYPGAEGMLNVSGNSTRLLQPISAVSANAGALTSTSGNSIGNRPRGECTRHGECLNGFGQCKGNKCVGFDADLTDQKLFRCVEGYTCNIKEGDITGRGIHHGFEVIAISPAEQCGTAPNLQSSKSLFANTNKWSCEGNQNSCTFMAGVGFRRNKTHTVEGVRLCGCPAADMNTDSIPCSDARDFYVPLGRIGVQECLSNAHCIDKRFAYCVFDHCGGFLAIGASVGIKAYQCIKNQDCTLEKIAAKAVNEALKVIPVAANFSCGADVALDPDHFQTNALPCLIDMNSNGECDINLGVTKALGTSRLCGCSGQDIGGNGRPCDELADFDADIGLLTVGECILDKDCGPGSVCAAGTCLSDNLQPYVVSIIPLNASMTVPPVTEIVLEWNENIKWGALGKRAVLQSLQDPDVSWEMSIPKGSEGLKKVYSKRTSKFDFSMEIVGQRLILTPDTEIYTLPEGEYRLGYEYGIVADLQNNPNNGAADIMFSIYKNSQCPYLYVTGFSTVNGNPNGLYESMEPINGKASWNGGDHKKLFIYWKPSVRDQPGNWVLDTNLEDNYFLAFPDLELIGHLEDSQLSKPPSGKWYKWSGTGRLPQEEVVIHCASSPDRTVPTLIGIEPKIGQTGWKPDAPIIMTFSEPITYGHWATLSIEGRNSEHNVTLVPDWEAGLRGKVININLPSLVPSGSPKSSLPPNVVELRLEKPLLPGEVYDIIAELGVFTDLAYNPWGPVERETLVFTTYGRSCGEFPSLGPSVGIEQHSLGAIRHGDKRVLSCAPGFSNSNSDEQRIELLCNDGKWSGTEIVCKADCGEYPISGSEYTILGRESNIRHGSSVRISCSQSAIQLGGSQPTEVQYCNDGIWDTTTLICGATCGMFRNLGINYKITELGGLAGDVLVGATRAIQCVPPAVPLRPDFVREVVQCQETGWAPVSLECHVPCTSVLPSPGEGSEIAEDGVEELSHGATRIVRCSSGFSSVSKHLEGLLRCQEGQWVEENHVDCKVGCPPLELGTGYNVEVLTGHGASHGTHITLTCKSNAVHKSGPTKETTECLDGKWTTHLINCKGPCAHPESQLGEEYEIVYLGDPSDTGGNEYMDGTGGRISCKDGTEATDGREPHDIYCDDGKWWSLNYRGSNSFYKMGKQVELECRSACLPPHNSAVVTLTPTVATSVVYIGKSRRTLAYRHTASADMTCAPGFLPASDTSSSQRLQCMDGNWNPEASLDCRKECDAAAIKEAVSAGNYRMSSTAGSMRDGSTRRVTCTEETEKLTGPAKDSITCKNGIILLPRLVCAKPSCHDGIMNGNETGVDCGGPNCPHSCSDVCTDEGVRGRKLGAKCGGFNCPPCIDCSFPPTAVRSPESYAVSQDGRTYEDLNGLINSKTVRKMESGSPLHVQCADGYYSKGSKPLERFRVVTCKGGEWELQSLEGLECSAPSCSDGVQNGNEWGVDCGGSCEAACPSCQDSVKNGDEEYSDCGGPFCLPCAQCSLAPLKRFLLSPNMYKFIITKKPQKRNSVTPNSLSTSDFSSSSASNLPNTAHGLHTRVSCLTRQAAGSQVDLQCVNGRWLPSLKLNQPLTPKQEDEMKENHLEEILYRFHLNCRIASQLGEGEAFSGKGWDNPKAAHFGVTNLGTIAKPVQGKEGHTYCIDNLLGDFNKQIRGECGALAFGSSQSKIRGLCEGTCVEKMKASIGSNRDRCKSYYEAKRKEDKDIQEKSESVGHILRGLLDVICHKHTETGDYCFATGRSAFSAVLSLQSFVKSTPSQLKVACRADSCFRSNIKYIVLMDQLEGLIPLLGDYFEETSRRVLGVNRPRQSFHPNNQRRDRRLQPWLRLPHRIGDPFDISGPATLRSLEMQSKLLVEPSRRSPGAFSFFHSISNIANILDLLCLESQGQSCAPHVLKIVSMLPSSQAPPPDTKGSGHRTSWEPCSHRCYSEVLRKMGQQLLDKSYRSSIEGTSARYVSYLSSPRSLSTTLAHPYDVLLGYLVKSYSRVYCQQSFSGTHCGNSIFPDLAAYSSPSASIYHSGVNRPLQSHTALPHPYIPANPQDFPQCKCPIEFIADGDCDLACYNEKCGWDGMDCLGSAMFPEVYQKLTREFPLEDPCNPYREDFVCLNSDAILSCSDHIKTSLKRHGCCLASSFEVLRDMLEFDSHHPLVKSGQISLTNLHLSSPFGPNTLSKTSHHLLSLLPAKPPREGALQTDRSAMWIEQNCQVSLDRTCSFALRRSVVALDFVIENLDYTKLFRELPQKSAGAVTNDRAKLRHMVRRLVAEKLGVPVSDVYDIKIWPGSVIMRVMVDAGWLSNTENFKRDIDLLLQQDVKGFADVLSYELNGSPPFENHSAGLAGAVRYTEGGEAEKKEDRPSNRFAASPFEAYRSDADAPIFVPKSSLMSETPPANELPVWSVNGAPPLPPYGTFGMGRLAPTLPRASCDANDIGVDVPENIDFFTEMYVVAIMGHHHGDVREVACAPGTEALAGTSPQDLVCDQGRWVPSSDSKKLLCRRPCQPYEEVDSEVVGEEYVLAGVGVSSGDTRVVSCARRYYASGLYGYSDEETLICNNGLWSPRRLMCSEDPPVGRARDDEKIKRCEPELDRLGNAYQYEQDRLDDERKVPAGVGSAVAEHYTRMSVNLTLYRISCARGFEHKEEEEEVEGEDQSQSGSSDLNSFYVACLDGGLYSLGRDPQYLSANEIESKRNEVDKIGQVNKQIEEFKDQLQNPSNVLVLQRTENAFHQALNCQSKTLEKTDLGPKPISDELLIALLFTGIVIALIVCLLLVWVCRRYDGPKKLCCGRRYTEQEKENPTDKEEDVDNDGRATDGGTDYYSNNAGDLTSSGMDVGGALVPLDYPGQVPRGGERAMVVSATQQYYTRPMQKPLVEERVGYCDAEIDKTFYSAGPGGERPYRQGGSFGPEDRGEYANSGRYPVNRTEAAGGYRGYSSVKGQSTMPNNLGWKYQIQDTTAYGADDYQLALPSGYEEESKGDLNGRLALEDRSESREAFDYRMDRLFYSHTPSQPREPTSALYNSQPGGRSLRHMQQRELRKLHTTAECADLLQAYESGTSGNYYGPDRVTGRRRQSDPSTGYYYCSERRGSQPYIGYYDERRTPQCDKGYGVGDVHSDYGDESRAVRRYDNDRRSPISYTSSEPDGCLDQSRRRMEQFIQVEEERERIEQRQLAADHLNNHDDHYQRNMKAIGQDHTPLPSHRV